LPDTYSQQLEQNCGEHGKMLMRIYETYTSKTVSWTGQSINNLDGVRAIKSGRQVVNRDLKCTRGIFLRALVDSPILSEGAC
jgi:putative transposase